MAVCNVQAELRQTATKASVALSGDPDKASGIRRGITLSCLKKKLPRYPILMRTVLLYYVRRSSPGYCVLPKLDCL